MQGIGGSDMAADLVEIHKAGISSCSLMASS